MYSKLTIIGNVGKQPELRYTPEGKAVCQFSVASNRTYGGKKETTWYRITVWDKTAEACNKFLSAGSKVFVEGRLTPDPETGNPKVYQRKDGTWGASFEVTASVVQFLDSKDANTNDDKEDEQIPF